ncbi:MAG: hypothetical protein QXH24_01085 [Candidatus Bathyarchaeia archaeon]
MGLSKKAITKIQAIIIAVIVVVAAVGGVVAYIMTLSRAPAEAIMIGFITGITGPVPIIGSFLFIFIKEWFSGITVHWMLFLEALLLVIVLLFPHGVIGYCRMLITRALATRTKTNNADVKK